MKHHLNPKKDNKFSFGSNIADMRPLTLVLPRMVKLNECLFLKPLSPFA